MSFQESRNAVQKMKWLDETKSVKTLVSNTKNLDIIVSTGCIQWILWFSIGYATAAAHRKIFDVNALSRKLHHVASPNLQDVFIGR